MTKQAIHQGSTMTHNKTLPPETLPPADDPARYMPTDKDKLIRLADPLRERLQALKDGHDLRFAGRTIPQLLGLLVNYALLQLKAEETTTKV